jgi:hypothetical protein
MTRISFKKYASVLLLVLLISSFFAVLGNEASGQGDENGWTGKLILKNEVQVNEGRTYQIEENKFSFKVKADNSIEGLGNGSVELQSDIYGCTQTGKSKVSFTVEGNYDPSGNKATLRFVKVSPSNFGIVTICPPAEGSSSPVPILLATNSFGEFENFEIVLEQDGKLSESKELAGGASILTRELIISGSCIVDIWVSAFLPPWGSKGRMPNPMPLHSYGSLQGVALDPEVWVFDYHEFSTDNRNVVEKGGSARLWSYVVVDLCNKDDPEVKKLHGIGETYGYRMEWNTQKQGLEEVVDKARASAGGMKESVVRQDDKVIVQIVGAAPNPLIRLGGPNGITFAPNIAYDFLFTISLNGDKINVIIAGSHNGFPAYEAFVGQSAIYLHTPKKSEDQNPLSPFNKGQSALSLFPPSEIPVKLILTTPKSAAFDKGFVSPTPTEAEESIQKLGKS